MTAHKLTACIPQGPRDLGAEVEVEITFTHSFGVPPTRTYPGHGDVIEFVKAVQMVGGSPVEYYGVFADLQQEALDDLASEWLADDGYAEACEKAHSDDEAAREAAEERRRDGAGAAP